MDSLSHDTTQEDLRGSVFVTQAAQGSDKSAKAATNQEAFRHNHVAIAAPESGRPRKWNHPASGMYIGGVM
jgi:hypothetical protein